MDNLAKITELYNCILDKCELLNIQPETLNHSVRILLIVCLNYSLDENSVPQEIKLLEIESILDFLNDELNTGHWSEVPIQTRRYFTTASFAKCLITLKNSQEYNEELLKKCLKCVDLGLLLGAPLEHNLELLTSSAKYLRKVLNKLIESIENKSNTENNASKRGIEVPKEFLNLPGKNVDSIECPSLEFFNKTYFVPQIPVKLKNCIQHWPALKKWPNITYLLEIAGDRTVPIEIGSHYVDETWTQKLMTLKEFIHKHYLSESGDIGYLAQHNLFEQITELKDDICIPEYCCLSLDYDNTTEPDINAWLGPVGTVSPLHHDPKNNLLAQIYGTKQIILFSPKDTPYLYPHEDKLLNNTAQVNPVVPDLQNYPKFTKTTMFKCLLEPGDMLFIPLKWWHHVMALDKSFSVSFWWQ
ncbi:unnamed protein product [Psylliodes chrysocephalus]|uniref:JmjC domain-containing protein n=1 Tax=Psylliodes chrysocephalus TaxID=3402493 RepID=A0A9P0DAU2_9CUCU|nr:unnamed protein product [Psylliodes chrysocephala]